MSYNLKLSAREIVALDEYFTNRIGYVGHEDSVSDTMHELMDVIGAGSEDARIQQEIEQRINEGDADNCA